MPGAVLLRNEDMGCPYERLPPRKTGFELHAIKFTPGIYSSNKPV